MVGTSATSCWSTPIAALTPTVDHLFSGKFLVVESAIKATESVSLALRFGNIIFPLMDEQRPNLDGMQREFDFGSPPSPPV
ncbi:hypothetical protein [Saccharococcus caldoxylosilyticus]|jgi:hypothetical protein|uniref:hypothetical protein n=1 Tax=Saccharococcus caldoxylosilyticus TaxID=81408 RepID=UPI0005A6F48D|nr:hypothetical protein [Parageobacillus caldoxylosilyticus]MBB3852568.1 hypothetical protein [Parageobacillus caldoxylosilyticus]